MQAIAAGRKATTETDADMASGRQQERKDGRPAGKAPARKKDPLSAPKRRRPKQERSRATVDQILAAAVAILEQGGFEAVTMQAIAAAAGINIATLYSYFPNKHHVLAHLARLRLDERLELLERELGALKERDDWINGYGDVMRKLFVLREGQASSVALRQAMHASPSLWEIDQEGNARAAGFVADLLHAKFPAIRREDIDIRARLIAEYVTATLDFIQRNEAGMQEKILEEIVALTASYLRSFAPAPERSPPASPA